ncbi:MAG: transposase [Magnetococcales bacterium]|nr:transposase [Magnetococcales bacterium]
MHNYLMLAPLILSRLRKCLSQVEISSSWGVPAIQETPDQLPSIVVFLEDDQPVQQTGQGSVQKITQTAHIFINSEPQVGQRSIKVTDRRTAIDFAELLREIVDDQYPDAEKVVPVMDNLNTHKPASLYQAFEPKEARRLLDRLEIHYNTAKRMRPAGRAQHQGA